MKKTQQWPHRCLPDIREAGEYPMIVPGCNQEYWHPTCALHLHEYKAIAWINGRRFLIKPGDMTLSPPRKVSRYAVGGNGTHLCIHFELQSPKVRDVLELPIHLSLGTQAPAARERFWRIIDYVRMADATARAGASSLLQELLIWTHLQYRRSATSRSSGAGEEAIRRLLQAIEGALDQNRLLSEWAAGAGLSSEYVARLFSRRFGMRLQHYILLRRIEMARHLMTSTDFLISEIGARVGLADAQYFNKQFRRVVGESPLAYRRRLSRRIPRKQPPS